MYYLFLIACIPIVLLMIALGKLKIAGHKVCPIAFVITCLLAVLVWNMQVKDIFTAGLEGVALAIWPIMLVIVAAVFTYNLSIYTGSMEIIKKNYDFCN